MRKAFDNISHILLRGKRYRIVLATKLGSEDDPLDGTCSDPKDKGKTIHYNVGLRGERRLDVLIHEMLHACFWDVREEGVSEAAEDIAHCLWKIGYRNGSDLAMLPDSSWPSQVIIRKRKYTFERVPGLKKGQVGTASRPDERNKSIKIRTSLRGEKELEAALRLLIMACYPDFDEVVATETSSSVARALWRMGYRRNWS